MNNKKRVYAAKYLTYALVMILLYVLQTTPGFLEIAGVKPNLVVPAAVGIAMMEGEFAGGLYGVLAGVFLDLGGFMLFGFNSIILLVAGVITGLLIIYMLRPIAANFTLILLATMLARGLLEYLLGYVMWGFSNVEIIFWRQILPTVVYTAVLGPLVFYLYRFMHRKFDGKVIR